MLLSPVIPVLAGLTPQAKTANTTKPDLLAGEGKDLLVKECGGCHQLTVITSQHVSESA